MATRKQDPEAKTFRQDAYASAAENERGVLGNLVAARCQHLTDRDEITVLWWLQQVSWREGGMDAFAKAFIEANREQIGTRSMLKFGFAPGQVYSGAQVRTVREEMGDEGIRRFPLRGDWERPGRSYFGETEQIPPAESAGFPQHYLATELHDFCLPSGIRLAENLLQSLVDPRKRIADVGEFMPTFWTALKEWRKRESDSSRAKIVETAITSQIFDELDFAFETRSFVLIEGREGIGKSEAARNWCDRHPGQAIYVRLESGSDETTLYRSIARRIGTACSYQRKAVEMRARIQDALQAGHVMLVLDEAHFLWPQSERSQRSSPKRLDWLRTALVDFGVPVALISTPQFFARQCDRFRRAGWNANQLQRRITRTAALPETLTAEDSLAVAKRYFPNLPLREVKRVAGVALLTLGYLSTISHLRKRVDFLASRRTGISESELVRAAIDEIAGAQGLPMHDASKAVALAVQTARITESEPDSVPRNRMVQTTERDAILA